MAGSPPKPRLPYDKKPVGRPSIKPNTNKPTTGAKVKPLPKPTAPKTPTAPKPTGKVKLPGKPRIPKPGTPIRKANA